MTREVFVRPIEKRVSDPQEERHRDGTNGDSGWPGLPSAAFTGRGGVAEPHLAAELRDRDLLQDGWGMAAARQCSTA